MICTIQAVDRLVNPICIYLRHLRIVLSILFCVHLRPYADRLVSDVGLL